MSGQYPDDTTAGSGAGKTRRSMLLSRLIAFAIVSMAAIFILASLGAPPLLILEVFSLAIILGISAVMVIFIFGRPGRLR